jgi:lipopolysaccharide transport system permease protein
MSLAGTKQREIQPSGTDYRRVITPASGFELPRPRDLWHFRDLIYLLMRRDVAIRYKQTVIGAAWAILQPLLFAVVLSVFLGRLARVPSGGDVPYPVFALSGMVLWLYFSNSLSRVSESAVGSAGLIAKVYFPRAIIPLAASAQPLVDFVVAFVVVVPAMLIYGVTPSPRILLLPGVVALTWLIALGAGMWFTSLNVRYRDVGFIVPFLTQVGLFMTPIVYPLSLIPDAVRPIYALNPMVGILETYRWMLFPGAPGPGWLVIIPAVAAPLLLISGAWYFQRAERDFADII